MSGDIKIYHVETLEDYNDLMVKLEEQGYRWKSGELPTYYYNYWYDNEINTIINAYDYDKSLTYASVRDVNCKEDIIKHKVKGVKQMEKVVVPQFVADWYGQYKEGYTLYGILSELNDEYYYSIGKLDEWIRSVNNARNDDGLANVQEIVAKMYLHGYEVEEKKEYYWRKKKEYLCDFEDDYYIYLNVNKESQRVYFQSKIDTECTITLLSETEVKQLVSEEDFKKLERVETDE